MSSNVFIVDSDRLNSFWEACHIKFQFFNESMRVNLLHKLKFTRCLSSPSRKQSKTCFEHKTQFPSKGNKGKLYFLRQFIYASFFCCCEIYFRTRVHKRKLRDTHRDEIYSIRNKFVCWWIIISFNVLRKSSCHLLPFCIDSINFVCVKLPFLGCASIAFS